ncbi:cytochrome c oxidase assembly factor Coa1 family protein [Tenacibaculum tangerinum]|uniref:Cytochrome c oxidase assembly factor Coa1 family protein n=1 Tax=Tenacibaculum tangerinum TaxID=3038772 RepID=A0ABY8KYV3_9FLAO|nr:cytochrome c oxidase assembly factor Coa1 family protein [Tenacibaculum tangerinum]WGH74412.1 cytochrome c oxidase assembly factor Coa1 family protein [Tenacibaculum tangerinum]
MNEREQKKISRRKRLWFTPLTGCLGVFISIFLRIKAVFFGAPKIISKATPFEYAIEQAFKNETVIENLGQSIEKYGTPSGNTSITSDGGNVDISIPIRGDKGEGTLIVKGIRVNGEWVYKDLYVVVTRTQEEINLLEKERALETV